MAQESSSKFSTLMSLLFYLQTTCQVVNLNVMLPFLTLQNYFEIGFGVEVRGRPGGGCVVRGASWDHEGVDFISELSEEILHRSRHRWTQPHKGTNLIQPAGSLIR